MRVRLAERVPAADAGRRLDEWAREWLARALRRPVSRSEVRRWIMAGAVRAEGARPSRPEAVLVGGRRIIAALRADVVGAGRGAPSAAAIDRPRILFEDEWLVAVDKPPGIPSHETVDPARPHLVGELTKLLAGSLPSHGKPGTLGVHQRLDRDTSGVILFTKVRKADAGLARQFAERSVEKTYHALTERPETPPAANWSATSGVYGRDSARTDFRILEAFAAGLLVAACPRTGRKHQIRLHLAEGGLPILGDDRYGSGASATVAPRLMLHASRLRLRHPVSGADLVIESPWPSDFRAVMRTLRARPAAQPHDGAERTKSSRIRRGRS